MDSTIASATSSIYRDSQEICLWGAHLRPMGQNSRPTVGRGFLPAKDLEMDVSSPNCKCSLDALRARKTHLVAANVV